MDNEKKLEREIEVYQKLAAGDKKVDLAALMINALQKSRSNLLPDKEKRWAYFLSLILPPLGFLFVVKFFTSGKDDARQAATMCLVLTSISILLVILFTQIPFTSFIP